MSDAVDHNLRHLSPTEARLGAAVARPKLLAIICVILLAALGWLYLALMIASMGGPARVLGPGMAVLDWLPRTVQVLCSPTFGLTLMPEGASGVTWSAAGFFLVAMMWAAMSLAMMLPSAAPMILAYAEIADTAARKGETIISPIVLAGGYTIVWLGFAAGAAAIQIALTRVALIDAGMASTSTLFSGAIFIVGGLYQFSTLKDACLRQCQRPFPFFFTHWVTTQAGVLRLGVKQGLYCLGCCWAMMLVMFAVGVMNIVWMAALGMVMAIEKMGTSKQFSCVVGAALIAVGIGFVLSAFAAHWPGRPG
jgi:predicted metal-binding membrane protein